MLRICENFLKPLTFGKKKGKIVEITFSYEFNRESNSIDFSLAGGGEKIKTKLSPQVLPLMRLTRLICKVKGLKFRW
jgi:hypothetical protein